MRNISKEKIYKENYEYCEVDGIRDKTIEELSELLTEMAKNNYICEPVIEEMVDVTIMLEQCERINLLTNIKRENKSIAPEVNSPAITELILNVICKLRRCDLHVETSLLQTIEQMIEQDEDEDKKAYFEVVKEYKLKRLAYRRYMLAYILEDEDKSALEEIAELYEENKKCNCKECNDIRDKIEFVSDYLSDCYNTHDTTNQKMLRDIADKIYAGQGFKTIGDIKRDFANEVIKKIGDIYDELSVIPVRYTVTANGKVGTINNFCNDEIKGE